jgi:hypothetical protein
MSVTEHDVSRRARELPRLDRMVAPRWLRERRRAQSRAARDAFVAEVVQRIVSRRAQHMRPFDADEHKRTPSPLTTEERDAFRAALAEARQQ